MTHATGKGTIFLSYARADDPAFVARLHGQLAAAGHQAWFDMVDMPSRGLTFLDEIRRAIQSVDRVLVVIGPAAISSDYVRAEWQCALAEGKVVVPLLRLGRFEDLPAELRPLNALNHLESRDAAQALDELIAKLGDPVPPLGALHGGVPDMPPHFRPRTDGFNAVARAVFADLEAPVAITAGQRAVVVHGMGAVGKSVVAAAFARATSTRRAFDDGVYWLSAAPTPLATLQRLAALLGVHVARSTGQDVLCSQVRQALLHRRVLIVLDDAADVGPLEPILQVLDVRTRLLVTSRNAELALLAGGRGVELRELQGDEALQLLADWSAVDPGALPWQARTVAEMCQGLPLALALNGAAAASTSWADVLDALKEADLAFAERRLAGYRYSTVAAALQASLSALKRSEPSAPARYRELVVFAHERGIPENAVVTLWGRTGELQPRDARKLVATLARFALVRVDQTGPMRRVVLHDLLQLQLKSMNTPRRRLHLALIDGYRMASPGGWTDAPADGYLHRHLVRHLMEAGRSADATALCLDPAWFGAVQRAEGLLAVDVFLAALDLVLEDARSQRDATRIVQGSLVATRFAETAPPEVVAVFADAGQMRRAERIAAACEFALDRCLSFCLLAERSEAAEDQARFLAEARWCLGSIDPTQRCMALYWVCRALVKTGASAEARHTAEGAWALAQSLPGDRAWNAPNALLWVAKAFRLLGDAQALTRVGAQVDCHGRNLELLASGVCGRVEALLDIPLASLYPAGLVRRGNLALACAEAGLRERCEQLFEDSGQQEQDAVRRLVWAHALCGHIPRALELAGGMADAVERAKAVRRVMFIAAACRREPSEVAQAAELAESLAGRAHEAAGDAWRVQAHLARALARAGRLDAACALAEAVCRQRIPPTEAFTLNVPERARAGVATPKRHLPGSLDVGWAVKTGPRPLDTDVAPLPDEAACERVMALARAGEGDAARAALRAVRQPELRVRALLEIVRHASSGDEVDEAWLDALLTARQVGRLQWDEVFAAGRRWVGDDMRNTVDTLDTCWQ